MARRLWWAPSKIKGRHDDKTKQPRPWRERKTNKPRYARWKCTPIPACGGTFPGGGSLLYACLSANLSCSFYSDGKVPPPGEGGALAPKGVNFPRAKGAVGLFSPGRSQVVKVLSISKSSILLIGSLRSPPPIPLRGTPSTGKHVTGFSGCFASLQIQFLCHPIQGGE